MRIFVCGATGLIGRHAVPFFLANGHTVTGLSRNEENAKKLQEMGVIPVQGDIATLDVLTEEASKCDVVLYSAFDHKANIAEEAKREGPAVQAVAKGLAASKSTNKLLFACAGIASFPPDKVIDEHTEAPPHFRSGATDALAEGAKHGMKVVAIRLAMLCHTPRYPHAFLEILYGLGKKEGAVPYLGEGVNRWTAASATDVGELISLVAEQQDKLQSNVVNYIHAHVEKISTKELAETIASQNGMKTASYTPEQIKALGSFFNMMILSASPNVPNEWTKETFGWKPTGNTLWGDAKEGKYWGKEW